MRSLIRKGRGLLQIPDRRVRDNSVSLGDTGELVDTVQYYINVLSQFYSSIPPVAATGVYDSATQNSVAQAQMQFGIAQTGTVDYQTWNAMESAVVGIGNTIDGEAG